MYEHSMSIANKIQSKTLDMEQFHFESFMSMVYERKQRPSLPLTFCFVLVENYKFSNESFDGNRAERFQFLGRKTFSESIVAFQPFSFLYRNSLLTINFELFNFNFHVCL